MHSCPGFHLPIVGGGGRGNVQMENQQIFCPTSATESTGLLKMGIRIQMLCQTKNPPFSTVALNQPPFKHEGNIGVNRPYLRGALYF